MRSKQIQ